MRFLALGPLGPLFSLWIYLPRGQQSPRAQYSWGQDLQTHRHTVSSFFPLALPLRHKHEKTAWPSLGRSSRVCYPPLFSPDIWRSWFTSCPGWQRNTECHVKNRDRGRCGSPPGESTETEEREGRVPRLIVCVICPFQFPFGDDHTSDTIWKQKQWL